VFPSSPQALKARPSPLLVHTRQVDGFFEFKVGLNAATLAHKALGALPEHTLRSFETSEPSVTWRLKSSNGVELGYGREGKVATFVLPSNRLDLEAAQPPHFVRVELRPEQLRSLTWMIAQEVEPKPWIEEEVAEAVLPQLGWHAEAKATRNVTVRGGVLADEGAPSVLPVFVSLLSSFFVSLVQSDTARLPSPSVSFPRNLLRSLSPPTRIAFP
jgi:hypothetical protein